MINLILQCKFNNNQRRLAVKANAYIKNLMEEKVKSEKQLRDYVSCSPVIIIILTLLGIVGSAFSDLTTNGVILSGYTVPVRGGLPEIIFSLMDIIAMVGFLYIIKKAVAAYGSAMNGLIWTIICFYVATSVFSCIDQESKVPLTSGVSVALFVLTIVFAAKLTKNYGADARKLGNLILICILIIFVWGVVEGLYVNLLTGISPHTLGFVGEIIPIILDIVLYLALGFYLNPRRKESNS